MRFFFVLDRLSNFEVQEAAHPPKHARIERVGAHVFFAGVLAPIRDEEIEVGAGELSLCAQRCLSLKLHEDALFFYDVYRRRQGSLFILHHGWQC